MGLPCTKLLGSVRLRRVVAFSAGGDDYRKSPDRQARPHASLCAAFVRRWPDAANFLRRKKLAEWPVMTPSGARQEAGKE
jgi:hypothetical protein